VPELGHGGLLTTLGIAGHALTKIIFQILMGKEIPCYDPALPDDSSDPAETIQCPKFGWFLSTNWQQVSD